MSKRFYCDDDLQYRNYGIFDLTKSDKTKEDFYDKKEEAYDIVHFEIYLVDETDSMLTGEEVCDTLNKQDKQIQEFISYFESQNKEKKELEFKLHTLRKWYTCRDCAFSEKELKYLRSLEE